MINSKLQVNTILIFYVVHENIINLSCSLDKLRSSLLDPGKALSLTDKAFDLAKGMTMKVNNVPVANKRTIKTEYDENNIKRKKEDLPIVKEEALSMGQVLIAPSAV